MLRVLFVEDEAIMRTAFRKMVDWDSCGYELAGITANGADALAYIDKNPIDIVVTDLMMPVMDGLSLICELKDRSFDGVILVLSNYTDFELVRKALTQGAADYMLKLNINGEILLQQLDAAAVRLRERVHSESDTESLSIPKEFDSVRKEVRDILQFIHAHYAEKLSLDDIAGAVSLNRSYICRIFRQDTGRNMFQYVNGLRMRKAAALIDDGNTYMREVAASVGIDDQFYFARLFKKYYHIPPSEYGKSKKRTDEMITSEQSEREYEHGSQWDEQHK